MLRPLVATLALGAVALGWMAWGDRHASRLMGDLAPTAARGHFAVTLDFAPESFHVTRLQAIGRVVEVKDRTIYMMDVRTAAMREFAEFYWVREVAAWPGR
jgi:hypothetical protein